MHRFTTIGVLLATCLTGIGYAIAAPVAGSYVLVTKNIAERGHFEIAAASEGHAILSLYREFGRAGSPDCCVRTGTLEKVTVRVSGNVALYTSPRAEGRPCQLVFVFSGKLAEVTQFGECGIFGVGVVATGRYSRAK